MSMKVVLSSKVVIDHWRSGVIIKPEERSLKLWEE